MSITTVRCNVHRSKTARPRIQLTRQRRGGRVCPVSARGKIFLQEQMFILAGARGFSGCWRAAARFQSPHAITAVFDSRNFSVDSRNENLPNKRIHQNYALIAVPVRPFLRRAIGRE
jgi:hypothetical protein